MVYDNLQEWEVIREMLADNPAGKNPKQIAAFLGVHLSVVYKWGQDPESSGSEIPKKQMSSFCEYLKDNRLIGFYAFQLGYRLEKINSAQELNGDFMDEFLRLDTYKGLLAEFLLQAWKDSKLDKQEVTKLLDLTDSMRNEIDKFQAEIRAKINSGAVA